MNDADARGIQLLEALDIDPPLVAAARQATGGETLAGLFEAVGERNQVPSPTPARRRAFAGLLVGAVAEQEFQQRYRDAMGGQQFSFKDQRASTTETDFLILNGAGRPAFRINIKSHGTFFQQAKKFVGLEPEDCFALATYKIRDAVTRSSRESLPFLFAIVSSQDLAAAPIAESLPEPVRLILDTSTLYRGISGWRAVEDALVESLLGPDTDPSAKELSARLREAVRGAEWRVISAARAFHLMNELLWERVPALAQRTFGRDPQSQPNMHFSLQNDMIGLDDLLELLRTHGLQHVATKIAFREI